MIDCYHADKALEKVNTMDVKKWSNMINYEDIDLSETIKPNRLFLDGNTEQIKDLKIAFHLSTKADGA